MAAAEELAAARIRRCYKARKLQLQVEPYNSVAGSRRGGAVVKGGGSGGNRPAQGGKGGVGMRK